MTGDGARRAFLGLGSNLGDRRLILQRAVAALGEVEAAGLVAVSPLYETDPVGGPAGQGPYLNLVAELRTALGPRELLALAARLEAEAGRVRAERWGPRTLDVDVLAVGDLRVDEPDLVVPHPRMAKRAFVLVPLSHLAPEAAAQALAGEGVSGEGWEAALAALAEAQGVRPAGSL